MFKGDPGLSSALNDVIDNAKIDIPADAERQYRYREAVQREFHERNNVSGSRGWLMLLPKLVFGCVVGLLFFNIAFGWPQKYNKFFYPDYVEFMWPMLLATVACFAFGAWATKGSSFYAL